MIYSYADLVQIIEDLDEALPEIIYADDTIENMSLEQYTELKEGLSRIYEKAEDLLLFVDPWSTRVAQRLDTSGPEI